MFKPTLQSVKYIEDASVEPLIKQLVFTELAIISKKSTHIYRLVVATTETVCENSVLDGYSSVRLI